MLVVGLDSNRGELERLAVGRGEPRERACAIVLANEQLLGNASVVLLRKALHRRVALRSNGSEDLANHRLDPRVIGLAALRDRVERFGEAVLALDVNAQHRGGF